MANDGLDGPPVVGDDQPRTERLNRPAESRRRGEKMEPSRSGAKFSANRRIDRRRGCQVTVKRHNPVGEFKPKGVDYGGGPQLRASAAKTRENVEKDRR